MTKLKVITLVMTQLPGKNYEYKAIDANGKVLITKVNKLVARLKNSARSENFNGQKNLIHEALDISGSINSYLRGKLKPDITQKLEAWKNKNIIYKLAFLRAEDRYKGNVFLNTYAFITLMGKHSFSLLTYREQKRLTLWRNNSLHHNEVFHKCANNFKNTEKSIDQLATTQFYIDKLKGRVHIKSSHLRLLVEEWLHGIIEAKERRLLKQWRKNSNYHEKLFQTYLEISRFELEQVPDEPFLRRMSDKWNDKVATDPQWLNMPKITL